MENKITYNGKTYKSINDLPPEARKIFEDKDGNSVPDIFDGMVNSANEIKSNTSITTSSYVVDGKTYNNLDEVPADKHELIREKLGKMNDMGLKPLGNKMEVQTNAGEQNAAGNLESASSELSGNFPFKLIMLFIFLGFMIFFIYSLIRMLTK